ncbi:beta-defensin 124 [Notamacropus eugenii]|uniref:beta-defensin 124 n=1 Tax=Notamacropus eugenii TaxID=9315 RepID=UPI003B67DFE8
MSCELRQCWKGAGTCRTFCTRKEVFLHFCKDNSMCCAYSFMMRKPEPEPENSQETRYLGLTHPSPVPVPGPAPNPTFLMLFH